MYIYAHKNIILDSLKDIEQYTQRTKEMVIITSTKKLWILLFFLILIENKFVDDQVIFFAC